MNRCQGHIVQYGQMIEQIEMLEYHTNILTNLIDICMFVSHIMSINDNFAGSCCLQLIQTTEKCGFTTSGRT